MIEGAVLAYLMRREADRRPDFIPADMPPPPDLGERRRVPKIPPQMREIIMRIGSYAKAITSGVAAGTASLVTAMSDNVIMPGEWITVALAVLGALGITYVVPNAAVSDPPTRTPGYRGGHGDPL